ncbi:MAG: VOC family protein, partial [Anaerolineales bacterium]
MTFSQGIHHITAIGSDPQHLVDFYTEVLGLRLVKKSVNQDDVSAYHLFFGDATGEPGMDLTFFTFANADPGARGRGQVSSIALAVPQAALPFWQDRLDQFEVKHEGIQPHWDWQQLVFYDFDDQRLELIGVPIEDLPESGHLWTSGGVGKSEAIRHFHSALLSVTNKNAVEAVLSEVLGYQEMKTEGMNTLYQRPGMQRAAFLEVEEAPQQPMGIN